MSTDRAGDRAATVVALVATGWLAVVAVADLLLPSTVVPDTLFAISPLIACSVLRPRPLRGSASPRTAPDPGRRDRRE